MCRCGMWDNLPGEDDGVVFRDVAVTACVFVDMPSWVVIVRDKRERPS